MPIRLSVIMATRNSARFMPAALESITPALGDQSDTCVEVLVADGGSTDGTPVLAIEDSRVRIVSTSDGGIYFGMNEALRAAMGDFIVILNSDDLLLPGVFGEALQALCEAPEAGWVSAPALFGASREGAAMRRHSSALTLQGAIFGIPAINARIFRRDVFDRSGYFLAELGLAADREFVGRLLSDGRRGLSFERPFYLYRVHEGSETISGDMAGRRRVYNAELQLARMLSDMPDIDPELRRLVKASGAMALFKATLMGMRFHHRKPLNFGLLRDLVWGLILTHRWRGRLSGY